MGDKAGMKILLVSEYFHPYGGAELSLWKLCRALTEKGHSISVVTSKRAGEAEHEIKEGIEVFRPFDTGVLWRRFLFSLKLYLYLNRWLKGRDIDVVYNLGFVPTMPATFIAAKYKMPAATMLGHLCGRRWFQLRHYALRDSDVGQAHPLHMGQRQTANHASDVAQRVAADVAKCGGIRRLADADAVQDNDDKSID